MAVKINRKVLFTILIAVVAISIVKFVVEHRNIAISLSCRGQFEQIAFQLTNYIWKNNELPNPVSNEKPYDHSWRMIIFKKGPYPEDADKYDLSESWNSLHNCTMLKNWYYADLFQCPGNPKRGVSNYIAIVTNRGDWFTSLCEECDSHQQILLVICDRNSRLLVAEPRDILLKDAWRIYEKENSTKSLFNLKFNNNYGIFWDGCNNTIICREYTAEDLRFLENLQQRNNY